MYWFEFPITIMNQMKLNVNDHRENNSLIKPLNIKIDPPEFEGPGKVDFRV